MAETATQNESAEHVVQIRRCACVVKGGRRFSFAALVVVGDRNGRLGWGYGKAPEVPQAVEKAVKQAERKMIRVNLQQIKPGVTVPHEITGRFGASKVLLLPASPGTGLIAGGAARVVLEAAGVQNGFAKQLGSKNHLNNARATIDGLLQMRTHQEVAEIRGKTVWEMWGN